MAMFQSDAPDRTDSHYAGTSYTSDRRYMWLTTLVITITTNNTATV
jgi:hypothetical protein